ncbi:hypothetical protein GQ53DRAFT_807708 [Thozetella sp. PMI_491]|nr:hypothetical protein GQ53DRAFT_807708 [Thozetella sp. PMI_491]
MSASNKEQRHETAVDPILFPPIKGPTEALRAFVDDVFNTVLIQQSTVVLNAAIKEYMSPLYTETANGEFVTHNEWLKIIMLQRKTLSNLYVIEKKIIVVPADEKGLTGQVVHIAKISGDEEGVGKFTGDCVGNYRVGLKKNGKMQIEDANGIAAIYLVKD